MMINIVDIGKYQVVSIRLVDTSTKSTVGASFKVVEAYTENFISVGQHAFIGDEEVVCIRSVSVGSSLSEFRVIEQTGE